MERAVSAAIRWQDLTTAERAAWVAHTGAHPDATMPPAPGPDETLAPGPSREEREAILDRLQALTAGWLLDQELDAALARAVSGDPVAIPADPVQILDTDFTTAV